MFYFDLDKNAADVNIGKKIGTNISNK